MVCHMVNGKSDSGFTFVELVVVMAMVALLVSIAVPRYFAGLERSKEAVLREDLYVMREAIDQFYIDKGSYPADLETLVEQRYIRTLPVDPLTGSSDTWVAIVAPQNPLLISDVRSGASGTGSDGQAYFDW